jgi:hypothetical protein
MKITIKEFRTLIKNGYKYELNFWNNNISFLDDLKDICDKYPSNYRKNPLGLFWEDWDYKIINSKIEIATSQREIFLKLLKEKGEDLNFHKDIEFFLEKYDLGHEWLIPIMDQVISMWQFPPIHNLHIQKSNKRVSLVLNPDTSLSDIKEVWEEIKKEQKKLWPNFKKINFSNKLYPNLFIAIEDRDIKETKDENFDESEQKNYKNKDLDSVGKLWENEEDMSQETDIKRMENLRQIRKRFKDKLS